MVPVCYCALLDCEFVCYYCVASMFSFEWNKEVKKYLTQVLEFGEGGRGGAEKTSSVLRTQCTSYTMSKRKHDEESKVKLM